MAYAPGAGASKPASRAPGSRPQSNGRPASRVGTTPVESKRPTVSFLAGLGVGLAIGAAAALLLAPRSGADTRRSLRDRGRRVGNRARDAWEDLRIELEATRRAIRRKRRDAKVEIEREKGEVEVEVRA